MSKKWIVAGLLAIAILAVWFLAQPANPAAAPAPVIAADQPKTRMLEERSSASAPSQAAAAPLSDSLLVHTMANGAPVAGAKLTVYLHGIRDAATGNVRWSVVARADSDDQGNARIAVPSGPLLVIARAAGFAPATASIPPGSRPPRVEIVLEKATVLGGHVVDAKSREPVPLARVWSAGATDFPDEERTRTTADTRGDFRLEGVPRGAIILVAEADGYSRSRDYLSAPTTPITIALSAAAYLAGHVVDASGAPAADAQVIAEGKPEPVFGSTDSAGAFALEVAPGAFRMKAQHGHDSAALLAPVMAAAGRTINGLVLTLGPGASIVGSVKGGDQPITGAELALSPRGLNGDLGRTSSDEKGAFTFNGLAPGFYDIDVTARGWQSSARHNIALLPGSHYLLDLKLLKPAVIEGVVHDENNHPVAAEVIADGVPFPVTTDEAGRFRIEGASSGMNSVRALPASGMNGVTQRVEVQEGATVQVEFKIPALGTVYGNVTAPHGQLPESVTIYLINVRSPSAQPGAAEFDRFANTTMNPDGSYSARVPQGSWSVSAKKPNYDPHNAVIVEAGREVRFDLTVADETTGTDDYKGIVLEPDGTPSVGATITSGGVTITTSDPDGGFHYQPAQVIRGNNQSPTLVATNGGRTGQAAVASNGQTNLTIQLAAAATVHGHLTGDPAATGFALNVYAAGKSWQSADAVHFAGDTFVLTDLLPRDTSFRAHADDGRVGDTKVTLVSGQDATVEIPLQQTCSASGRVLYANGAPASGAWVMATNLTSHATRSFIVKSDGGFNFTDLYPADYTLRATHDRRMITVPFSLVSSCAVAIGDVVLPDPPATPGK